MPKRTRPPGRWGLRRGGLLGVALPGGLVAGVLAAAALTVLPAAPAAAAGPRPDFQLPFPCGQQWQLNTYASDHAPALDMVKEPNQVGTEGALLVAPAAGRVNQSYRHGNAGNMIQIDHGGGWYTTYIHLQSRSVAVGQQVGQGQEIGRVGKDGETSNGHPHLHFELGVDADGDGEASWGLPGAERVNAWFDGVQYAGAGRQFENVTSRNCGQSTAVGGVSVGVNADGRLEQFVVRNSQVFHRYQLSTGGWSGWDNLGGSSKGPVAVAKNSDGRLEIFTVGIDGSLYNKYQLTANAGWVEGWGRLTGQALAGPVTVVPNADGRLQVFAVGTSGHLFSRYQLAGGGWSPGWDDFGGSGVRTPVAGLNADGRVEVFAVHDNNTLYHRYQLIPNGGWSGDWSPLAGQTFSGPLTVAPNADGRLQVIATGSNGRLYSRYQLAEGGWSPGWDDFGGNGVRIPSLARNADGRLEVFVVAADGSLYNKYQLTPNAGWVEGWSRLAGATLAGALTAATNTDGRLEIFAQGSDGHIYARYQNTPGGAWSNWLDHGQP